MFDIGWQELFVVGVLAIIIVGPKDIPRAIRTVRGWLRKAKSMARDFQNGMEDIVREAELEDIRKEAEEAAGFNLEDAAANFDLEDEIRKTIDPTGEVTKELEDLTKVTDEDEDEDDATDEEETGQTTAENDAPEDGKKVNG